MYYWFDISLGDLEERIFEHNGKRYKDYAWDGLNIKKRQISAVRGAYECKSFGFKTYALDCTTQNQEQMFEQWKYIAGI